MTDTNIKDIGRESLSQGWDAISVRDKEYAAAYWGNDNPPLELQVSFTRYREEITSEFETMFWSIVDREGLSPVPSDMWDALAMLTRATRNRDMWKGQSERQAATLHALRMEGRQ